MNDADIAHNRRIEERAGQLPEQIQAASGAALEAHLNLTVLHQMNDVDLFDGAEGGDALHEIEQAMRHLRNARRIAERRAELIELLTAGADGGRP